MRVWKEEDLLKAWETLVRICRCGMYLEKIEEPRHSYQVIGDSYGKACHFLKETCFKAQKITGLKNHSNMLRDRTVHLG
jgi:acetyl/propionyl-CoA carboxylase alpha subunit